MLYFEDVEIVEGKIVADVRRDEEETVFHDVDVAANTEVVLNYSGVRTDFIYRLYDGEDLVEEQYMPPRPDMIHEEDPMLDIVTALDSVTT